MLTGIILAIIIVIILIIIIWAVVTRNRFERMNVKIQEADSGIDVALTKRYDILTKMLDVTKAYASHEAETLASIVRMRANMSMSERNDANRQMNEVEGKLSILAESYPELRSAENFRQLQTTIAEVEEHLQASRRIYNMNVSTFNQLLVTWPAKIIGNSMKLMPKEFFEADEVKWQDAKMEF